MLFRSRKRAAEKGDKPIMDNENKEVVEAATEVVAEAAPAQEAFAGLKFFRASARTSPNITETRPFFSLQMPKRQIRKTFGRFFRAITNKKAINSCPLKHA